MSKKKTPILSNLFFLLKFTSLDKGTQPFVVCDG